MGDTLILNADGMPLSVVPLSTLTWQESVKQVFTGAAAIMAEYEDWDVHSPSITMTVPSVLMLNEYVKASRGVKFSRVNVLLRDRYQCQYCDLDAKHEHGLLTLDHVVARFHGGKTRWDNVVAACGPCNLEKAHFTKMKPRNAPVKPDYYSLVAKRMTMPIVVPHESWKDFLGWDPDLVTVRPHKRK
jgi:5-methylcytosine-specific restriction endonuclease McrA